MSVLPSKNPSSCAEPEGDETAALESRLGHRFADPALLVTALTHRSLSPRHNERLEFLGDAVLGMAVADWLYRSRPQASEGDLSRLRARLVRGESLAALAREQLGLEGLLRLGEGEVKGGGRHRASLLANALEAVIGALYLDGGYPAVTQAVRALFQPVLDALPASDDLKDPKTRLQEWLQGQGRALPVYEIREVSGPEHRRRFTVACQLDRGGGEFSAAAGSRRRAEQAAARRALEALGVD